MLKNVKLRIYPPSVHSALTKDELCFVTCIVRTGGGNVCTSMYARISATSTHKKRSGGMQTSTGLQKTSAKLTDKRLVAPNLNKTNVLAH